MSGENRDNRGTVLTVLHGDSSTQKGQSPTVYSRTPEGELVSRSQEDIARQEKAFEQQFNQLSSEFESAKNTCIAVIEDVDNITENYRQIKERIANFFNEMQSAEDSYNPFKRFKIYVVDSSEADVKYVSLNKVQLESKVSEWIVAYRQSLAQFVGESTNTIQSDLQAIAKRSRQLAQRFERISLEINRTEIISDPVHNTFFEYKMALAALGHATDVLQEVIDPLHQQLTILEDRMDQCDLKSLPDPALNEARLREVRQKINVIQGISFDASSS